VNRSLDANALNVRAYGLKASILRHLGRAEEAARLVSFARDKCDPLDVHLMAEQWLATKDPQSAMTLFSTLNSNPATAQETASEYLNCGLWSDGITLLQEMIKASTNKSGISPMLYYYLGYFSEKLGDVQKSEEYRRQAALQSPEYVFPFQHEAIPVLQNAIKANPDDSHAAYYLGNLLYDWQPEKAVALWEKSAESDPDFPITWRNLAIAYSHQKDDSSLTKAIFALEKAVSLNNQYSAHFAELERLYQAAGIPVEKRLALLEKYQKVVVRNDEALGILINLKTFAGKAEESIKLLQGRTFSIWEGATPFNTGQAWMDAHLVHGIQLLRQKKYPEALADFEVADNPPENLRADQRRSSFNVKLAYLTGCAYDGAGEKEKARKSWNDAISSGGTVTESGARRTGSISLFRGEQQYYQALARQKLGNKEGSQTVFNELVTSATTELKQTAKTEADASQAPLRGQSRTNVVIAHYNAGLGYSGLGNKIKAKEEFNEALKLQPDYLDAKIALEQL
jgi:tetratricopeptide (TPR) repeat protein